MTPTSSVGNRPLRVVVATGVALGLCCLIFGFPLVMCGCSGDSAKRVAAKVEIDLIMTAIETYKADAGEYPREFGAIRPYLTKGIPKDPWGRAFVYKYPGGHGERPDVTSLGADGKEGGEGSDADIVSWQ